LAITTLSFFAPCALIDEAAPYFFRRERPHEAPARTAARRSADPQPILVRGVSRTIEVKIASEPDEWEQAFQLVAGNYQQRGYQAATAKPYRFTPYHALPDTTVFVATTGGRVVATFSLVADNSVLGLPLEDLYPEEIAGLRRQGRRLAEVTSLACSDLGQREFLQTFTTMIRLMKQYHVSRGGDTWVITVNPRHRAFYCKVLGYQSLGPCKAYASVSDAPAEAYWVDGEAMRADAPRGYAQVFGEALPADALRAPPMPRPFIRYFGSESSQTDEGRVSAILRTVAAVGTALAW
jgi:hypothetical protein